MGNIEEIVIVGGGIIGVCTAYFISKHPKFDPKKHHITLLEARRPAGGASGKAGGLLALWAFPSQIVPLSFELHQQLAEEYNGSEEWGYRRVDTWRIEGDISKPMPAPAVTATAPGGTAAPGSGAAKAVGAGSNGELPKGLDWLRPEVVSEWFPLGGADTTAQVHPYKFTTTLLKKALESDAINLVIGSVSRLYSSKIPGDTGSIGGVEYITSDGVTSTVDASKVILAMGPWTSKLLPECPISGLRAHSITIAPTRQVSANALFTELRLGRHRMVSPEVYPRADEVYLCGEGDASPVPDSTDDVEVVREKCEELFSCAAKISPELQGGKLLRTQACYLPVVDVPSCSGPFIGETNVSGLYLASGHSCWGINNAPATGKLMSELVLDGKAHSASLSGLDPKSYFDVELEE